jgi:uncharacterized protein YgiM (DUF1202 family)
MADIDRTRDKFSTEAMNFTLFRSFRGVLCLSALIASVGHAAETATISAGTANVRGRAGFIGEVITHLKQGDTVTILDRVTLTSPEAGEPAEWLKIALPANTPVWVHGSYVDAASKTVTASRLTVRGGAGINYSVLGFLSQGTPVKEIRRQGDWLEIEPTDELHAFVAASVVKLAPAATSAAPAVAIADSAPAQQTPATPPPVEATTPAPQPAATTTTVATPVVQTPVAPVGSDIGTPVATAPPTTPPATTTIIAEPAPAIATPPVDAGRELTIEERAQQVLERRTRDSQRWEVAISPDDQILRDLPEHRRQVTREGKIRRAISIQAPGDFILTHAESGLRLNYLYTSSTNLPLKELHGVKVRIQGEEGIDSRWPGTPVLLIKSLEVLP